MRYFAAFLVVAAQFASLTCSQAADPRFPDWPCNQIKVPELSPAAMWTGPAIDKVGNSWEDDAKVKDLVERLAARRTSPEEAQELLNGFIVGSPAEKAEKATTVFAGLFETLNRQRTAIMDSIERYVRRQRDFAEKIRTETHELWAAQDAPNLDQTKVDDLANRITWDTRVFEDRKKTISYVCDAPVTIERRLFSLARDLQQLVE